MLRILVGGKVNHEVINLIHQVFDLYEGPLTSSLIVRKIREYYPNLSGHTIRQELKRPYFELTEKGWKKL